jgi:hypothetical protein
MSTPAAVRYPRGTGPGVEIRKEMSALPIGRGEIRRKRGSGATPSKFRSTRRSYPFGSAGDENNLSFDPHAFGNC